MKQICFFCFTFTLLLVLSACPSATSVPLTEVVFVSAEPADGESGLADTTVLRLFFSADPETLTAQEIQITGAVKGALSGSGLTRTLAISSISVCNAETLTISITSPKGYSLTGSTKNTAVYRFLAIGLEYLGGRIAYILQQKDPGYIEGEFHGIIAARENQHTLIRWWNQDAGFVRTGTTATALGTGQANTTEIVTILGPGSHAAQLCADYVNPDTGTGIFSDWHLPSKDELNQLCINKEAIGGFTTAHYFSSSEINLYFVWAQNFGDGEQIQDGKNYDNAVRAIRYF